MKGWYGNKHKHSLASRGIKTSNSFKVYPYTIKEWKTGFTIFDMERDFYIGHQRTILTEHDYSNIRISPMFSSQRELMKWWERNKDNIYNAYEHLEKEDYIIRLMKLRELE